MYLEQFPEVGATGGQDDPVRLETFTIAREGDIDKVLVIPQIFKGGRYAALIVVPAQAKMLRVHHFNYCLPAYGTESKKTPYQILRRHRITCFVVVSTVFFPPVMSQRVFCGKTTHHYRALANLGGVGRGLTLLLCLIKYFHSYLSTLPV